MACWCWTVWTPNLFTQKFGQKNLTDHAAWSSGWFAFFSWKCLKWAYAFRGSSLKKGRSSGKTPILVSKCQSCAVLSVHLKISVLSNVNSRTTLKKRWKKCKFNQFAVRSQQKKPLNRLLNWLKADEWSDVQWNRLQVDWVDTIAQYGSAEVASAFFFFLYQKASARKSLPSKIALRLREHWDSNFFFKYPHWKASQWSLTTAWRYLEANKDGQMNGRLIWLLVAFVRLRCREECNPPDSWLLYLVPYSVPYSVVQLLYLALCHPPGQNALVFWHAEKWGLLSLSLNNYSHLIAGEWPFQKVKRKCFSRRPLVWHFEWSILKMLRRTSSVIRG